MYRTVEQIESTMQFLAAWFPSYFTRVQLPETSVEGRTIHALRMRAGGGGDRKGVLFVGGVHARELMNPDAILDLAIDLFASHARNTDLNIGEHVWPKETIQIIVESLDLWFFPCVNPDGRNYVMTVDDMWRKNRRDNSPRSECVGVDLNRNMDMLWAVTAGASCNPCSNIYCGPSVFSEPETRNVKFMLDTKRIDCFVDVHSYSELVLHPWGHAPTQTTDPTMQFTSLSSGTCSPLSPSDHEEFMPPRDLQRYQTVAQRIVDAIASVRGRLYTPQHSNDLYATTGTHENYAYSRHIADSDLRKTYSFTFETGPWMGNAADSFHPADPDPIILDAKSGMIALAHQCVCAIELIGNRFLIDDQRLDVLRRVRDESLAMTDAGRQWIDLFERLQGHIVEVVLQDEKLAREAGFLVGRAVEIVERDKELDNGDIEKIKALFLGIQKDSSSKNVTDALGKLLKRIPKFKGCKAAEVIESLMKNSPLE